MYKLFFYLNSRECAFSDHGASRLAVSDTDSLTNSLERSRSNTELNEIYLLMQSGVTIPFQQTYHAQRYAEMYIKSIGPVLDFSSITEEVKKNCIFLLVFSRVLRDSIAPPQIMP